MRGLAVAALLVAAVASGCGAHAVEDAPSLDEVAAATRSDPYRFEITLTSEGLLDDETAKATGAADPAAERGFVRYSFEEMSSEIRQIGSDTYVRFTAADGANGGWTKQSTAGAEVLAGPFGAFSHPHHAADALARHGRHVAAGPGEPIEGAATTHYRGSVPTLELFGRRATGSARDELEEDIRESRSESTSFQAWAGPEGILRRLELTIPVTEDGRTGRVIASVRFVDFGRPVEVEAPPAAEVSRYGIITEEGETQPCTRKAAPHTAEDVIDALRRAGYDASGSCEDDETVVIAFPERDDGDDDNDAVMCFVTPSPEPDQSREGLVVDGNVACGAEPSQRKTLRTILDDL